VQVNTPAADIDQLTWLGVGQHPLVLRHGGRRPRKDNVTAGKQQSSPEGGQNSARGEGGIEKPWNNVSVHVHLRPLFL
jgi:hypothetical protein